ncbi:glycosyltransferase family 2 protein [uncultured Flavonifractor sp.]|uniref:glycosyltransferase family 2 protein n=1 Tax=uncultured Flavonifractor sp. TaxID=1193534 RepID=UPI002616AEAB|nr:glycosyltransferase family 2 protein [uncultured Flavonifractor sp.]
MVSIIVPIYNTEQYLRACLESIRTQTYSDIEIIMIDDGSTDSSKNVANSYVEKDIRFRLYSQENRGVSAARNYGLGLARGEYILFIDSDDWLEAQMIEKLVDQMVGYSVDISCCQYDRYSYFSGEVTETWNKDVAIRNFLVHKKINGSLVNKLFKSKLIKDKMLDESIKYGEDALFLWKALLDVRSISVSPDVLYHVTLHDDSASGGGSYKPIRKDCIKVWNEISSDAKKVSLEFGSIARAQLANMAFFSLYEMGYYGYKDIQHQKYYSNTLKNTITDMCKVNFIPFSEKCLAYVFLLNVNFGMTIIKLIKKFRS